MRRGVSLTHDCTQDVSLFAIILWSYLSIEGQISTRQKLAFSAALIWNARLLGFLGYRIIVRGSDFRFDKLIKVRATPLASLRMSSHHNAIFGRPMDTTSLVGPVEGLGVF